MKKRVFIAINLPENIKDKIEKSLESLKEDFINDALFISRNNWHITVSFLGWQGDESIYPILKGMKETIKDFSRFKIEIDEISYGPKNKPPRMIWLNCGKNTSKDLSALKDSLESKLMDEELIFKQEHRQMKAHITLARFQAADTNGLPDIKTNLNLNFEAETMDLMESHLARSGAKYEIMQRFPFHN